MVSTTRKAWSSPAKSAAAKPDGKWKKVAPREGGVFKHPSGKYVARRLGFTDSHHDTEEAAQKHVDGWAEAMKKFSEHK
jgi:hypothetical protein